MKALKIIGNILLWVFIVFAALMTVLALTSQNDKGVPSVFGKMPTVIVTESMQRPSDVSADAKLTLEDGTVVDYANINQGDWVFNNALSSAERDTLKVGDIITFKADIDGDGEKNENKTHRIIAVNRVGDRIEYTTKGDNNAIKDTGTVMNYDVVGVYSGFKLPAIGNAIMFLQSSIGFLCCIVIPLILFFLYELYRFIMVIVSRKKKALTADEEAEIKKKAVEEYLAQQNTSDKETAQAEPVENKEAGSVKNKEAE